MSRKGKISLFRKMKGLYNFMDISEGNIIHVEGINVIITLLSGMIETYFIKDHFNCCLLNHTLVAC